VTPPGCKYCPAPEFSPEARAKKVSKAKSVLRVTVRAMVAPPILGWSGQQVTVWMKTPHMCWQTWQFVPGHLPDGTAVPTRVDIEVTFELR